MLLKYIRAGIFVKPATLKHLSMSMCGLIIVYFYAFYGLVAAAQLPQEYPYAEKILHQPHSQYGITPSIATDAPNDFMTAHAANIGTNSALNTKIPFLAAGSFAVNTLQQESIQQQHQQLFYERSLIQTQPQLSTQYLQQQPIPYLYEQHANKPETIISKRFYLHTAPEDDDNEEMKHYHLNVGKSRKNYNIVFIKSPDKAKSKTSLTITPAINEEKTVIYVLNKKHEAADIDAQVHEPITSTAKPEVYFIKYKTADEAAHAQHRIQAQYDALGGSTQIINEGIAPESSIIRSMEFDRHAATEVVDAHEETQPIPTAYAEEEEISQNTVDSQSDDVQIQPQTVGDQLSSVNTNNGYLPPVRYYRR